MHFVMYLLKENMPDSFLFSCNDKIERLRNENEDKAKQSFNQYSENETKIFALNYPKSCVFDLSSFTFRNLSNTELKTLIVEVQ